MTAKCINAPQETIPTRTFWESWTKMAISSGRWIRLPRCIPPLQLRTKSAWNANTCPFVADNVFKTSWNTGAVADTEITGKTSSMKR